MKKIYTVNLDEDKVNELKVWLEKNGQTFSGYLNILIGENLEALKKYAPKGDKTRLSIFTLLGLASRMTADLKKELKK
ncbi:MAG: hypothetical protein Q8R57_16825 [Bacteroidota bacterium]|nr:hypothetical protein [Bacteroidota bacterium]